jgi:uncharacterized ubiquitin-like protein YukD
MSVVIVDKPIQTASETAGVPGFFSQGEGRLTLRLVDHLGRATQTALPAHTPLSRIRERIVERLQISPFDSNGQPVIYDLVHNGKVLIDDDTLTGAGVRPDDIVELTPSIQSA